MSDSNTTAPDPSEETSRDGDFKPYANIKARLDVSAAECDGREESFEQRSTLVRSTYLTAQSLLGQAEASKLQALAHAYSLAEKRSAKRPDLPPEARGFLQDRDRRFAWHLRSIMGELSFVARETDISLRNQAYDAQELVAAYPEWVDTISEGRIDIRHAKEMLKGARSLAPDLAQELSKRVLEFALEHSIGQTRKHVEREVAKLAAEEFEESHERERARREVCIKPTLFGMAYLTAYLPLEQVKAIDEILTLQARALREDGERDAERARMRSDDEFVPDDRTTAQIRADVFTETLLTATPNSILESETAGAARITATVNVTVPVLSLLDGRGGGRGDGSDPALLDGTMPMSFAEARQLASTVPTLQRVLTHPITGHTVCVDTYSPDKSMRRFLQVRDAMCRFPGCARPASGSDLDHTVPYSEGGATSVSNLAHLCRAHHVQKHHSGWGVKQVGRGVLEFTTPLGHRSRTEPIPMGPRFRPTGERLEDPPKNSASGPPDESANQSADDHPPF